MTDPIYNRQVKYLCKLTIIQSDMIIILNYVLLQSGEMGWTVLLVLP